MALQGIDVSHWQGQPNWKKVKRSGIAFALIKATQGTGFTDPEFERNWSGAAAAGLARGAYHFGVGTPGAAQAKHFLEVVKPKEGDLLVLDYENNPDGPDMTVSQALAFVREVEKKIGHPPILYSFDSKFGTLAADPVLGTCCRWVARYGPEPATEWDIWQYTSSGSVGGITGRVDRNRFDGTLDKLKGLAGQTPAVSYRIRRPNGEVLPGVFTLDDALETLRDRVIERRKKVKETGEEAEFGLRIVPAD